MTRLLTLLLVIASALSAQVIVLTHATVIDGTGRPPIKDAAIVMVGGKIREVGPSSRVKMPDHAEVVDVTGKTIMPGIINLHGHVGMVKGLSQDIKNYTRENVVDNLRTYAMYGVTTTTSMGTDADLIVEMRDEQRREKLFGARVFTALQGFTALGGYPTQAPGVKGVAQEVASAAQVRARVDQLARKGADLVKVWVDSHHGEFPKIAPEVYEAIIEQGHKRGMIAAAHVYELADAKGLIEAGIDLLGHSVRDVEVDADLIAKAKKNGVTSVSTLTREVSTYIYSDPPAWLNDPFFQKGTTPEVIEAVKTTMKTQQSKPETVEQGKKDLQMAMRNLKKLADAGVRIGFGTDTGPPGRFPGFFEHLEMELMVEAGLTPMQVIESFSKNAAQALKIAKDFGTLEKGKAADLVVLEKNPLDDIRNTRTIQAVYLGGRRFE